MCHQHQLLRLVGCGLTALLARTAYNERLKFVEDVYSDRWLNIMFCLEILIKM